MAARKKSNGGTARRAAVRPGVNPNTPVSPPSEGHEFAEREPVTENPNTPVSPETPEVAGAIPFAERDGAAAADAGDGE